MQTYNHFKKDSTRFFNDFFEMSRAAIFRTTLNQTLSPSAWLRSSLPKIFSKKGAPKNFVKFAGKHICWWVFFNWVWLKKRIQPKQLFSYEFCKIFENIFFRPPSEDCFLWLYPEALNVYTYFMSFILLTIYVTLPFSPLSKSEALTVNNGVFNNGGIGCCKLKFFDLITGQLSLWSTTKI